VNALADAVTVAVAVVTGALSFIVSDEPRTMEMGTSDSTRVFAATGVGLSTVAHTGKNAVMIDGRGIDMGDDRSFGAFMPILMALVHKLIVQAGTKLLKEIFMLTQA
jgi:hypothetical protein